MLGRSPKRPLLSEYSGVAVASTKLVLEITQGDVG
jgi:hypothetical protein